MIIKRGATLESQGMLIGLALIVLGIYLLNQWNSILALIPGALFILFGVLIFPWIVHMEIDGKNLTIRKLLIMGPFKITLKSQAIKNPESVTLKLFSQNQRMNNLSQTANVRTRTYDIHINCPENSILVSESPEYKLSLIRLDEISKLLEIPSINKFEEMKESLQSRRRR